MYYYLTYLLPPKSLSMGKYFEEFKIGEEFISPGRTVTESDIVSFAGLSGDYNPLHTNEEFAKESVYKGRIAKGCWDYLS